MFPKNEKLDVINKVFEECLKEDSLPYEIVESKKNIVGIIRFSVLSDVKNYFKKADDISFEDYAKIVLDDKRLLNRFKLFEAITLPSLSVQEFQNFLIYVIAPNRLPEVFKKRLVDLQQKYSFLRVVYCSEKGFMMKHVSNEILSEIDLDEAFATFRLDDDDALRFDFTKRLTRYVKARNKKLAVSFCKGYVIDIINKEGCKVEEVIYPNTGAGIAVIGGPSYRKTIFDVSEKHKRMHIRLPVITDGRQPAYAITTHGENDTGEGRRAVSVEFSLIETQNQLGKGGFFTKLSELK